MLGCHWLRRTMITGPPSAPLCHNLLLRPIIMRQWSRPGSGLNWVPGMQLSPNLFYLHLSSSSTIPSPPGLLQSIAFISLSFSPWNWVFINFPQIFHTFYFQLSSYFHNFYFSLSIFSPILLQLSLFTFLCVFTPFIFQFRFLSHNFTAFTFSSCFHTLQPPPHLQPKTSSAQGWQSGLVRWD